VLAPGNEMRLVTLSIKQNAHLANASLPLPHFQQSMEQPHRLDIVSRHQLFLYDRTMSWFDRREKVITCVFSKFTAHQYFLWLRSRPTEIPHSLFSLSLFRDVTFSDVRSMAKRLHNKIWHWRFVIFTIVGNIGWLPDVADNHEESESVFFSLRRCAALKPFWMVVPRHGAAIRKSLRMKISAVIVIFHHDRLFIMVESQSIALRSIGSFFGLFSQNT
jgi:hypothetical protein